MAPDPAPDVLASAQSQASVFRLLTWKASIPLEITIGRDSLPGSSNQDTEAAAEDDGLGEREQELELPRYYMQVPRYTYLPLLLPEIEQVFLPTVISSEDLASSHSESESKGYRREDYWFEVEWDGKRGKQREVCKWHWSIDMLQLHTYINSRNPSTSSSSSTPLRLVLHLKPPEPKSSIGASSALSNSVDACRISFISLLKEADYIRWGNTRRITGLRKADLEGAWNGIVEDNYEAHSRFANKIVPLPLPGTSSSSTDSSTQPPENLGVSGPDSCFAVRSIPLKIYLPDNAPEVQDIVTPRNAHGTPTTILQTLNQTLPLLFPHAEPTDSAYALATPILYCVPVPPEAEVAWLAACVAAPDGWLRIGVVLH